MMLLIDNYDSFTYNLAHLFGALGEEVVVLRNDEPGLEELEPDRLVISPGPGETTRCDGASRAASSASTSSFRSTVTSAPSAPNRCARLYVNES